jgi:gamma-glutamyltranspeptidase/glutathione hydrolase
VAVAAPNADAVAAATEVALAGGNAVDACLAATVVAMVTEPGVVSPLGGAFVAVDRVGAEPVVVDGNVEMPGRGAAPERFGAGLREVVTEYGGGLTMHVGHGSAATPGAMAALGLAHERYGRAPWAEVLAPATEVCRRGYRLGSAAGSYLALVGETVFGWDPQTRAALRGPTGGVARTGDLLQAPDLAAALEVLAAEGWSALYTGGLAEVLVADMAERGGLVTAADLAAYEACSRPGLPVRLGSWTLSTNPPPAIGGPVLATMLRLLADHPSRSGRAGDAGGGGGWGVALVEVQRAVLSYRAAHLDAADDLAAAGTELLALVDAHGWRGLTGPASTAHVSVVDGDGNACATTCSSGYGSGATVPGTGMLLNNALGEPELNRRGLHALQPGARLASNMAPTTGRSDDGAVLAVGSPGADRITTALLQVLGAFCLDDARLQEAIDAPRLHVRVAPDGAATLEHEADLPGVDAVLAAADLVAREHPARHMYFGGVGVALRGRDGGLQAAADPRRAAATGMA